MSASRHTGITGGVYKDLGALTEVSHRIDTLVRLTSGERYSIDASNKGNGIAVAGGNFANPISEPLSGFINIATSTTLVIGNKYLSTATASHVVPTGQIIGDEIQITWKDGTTMTLTSASNISVTSSVKTTDTTWVFTNFISILTLVWDGTEWGIK
jgi:hypothetical protein